jgi:MFS-type transporter involved in bile tolerance (Atg22 family)
MTEDHQPKPDRRLEEPLHVRKRLSVPQQPAGDPPTRFANMSLGLDAAFCNVVGLIFTLIGAFVADRLGMAGWLLTTLGVLVLLWSFMVTLYANRRVSRRHEVERVIKINVVILIASVIGLFAGGLTSDGKVVVGIWALFTLGFTIAQVMASRGLPATTP